MCSRASLDVGAVLFDGLSPVIERVVIRVEVERAEWGEALKAHRRVWDPGRANTGVVGANGCRPVNGGWGDDRIRFRDQVVKGEVQGAAAFAFAASAGDRTRGGLEGEGLICCPGLELIGVGGAGNIFR